MQGIDHAETTAAAAMHRGPAGERLAMPCHGPSSWPSQDGQLEIPELSTQGGSLQLLGGFNRHGQ
jgi:hypothetical protein